MVKKSGKFSFWVLYYFFCPECRTKIKKHVNDFGKITFDEIDHPIKINEQEQKYLLCKNFKFNCRLFLGRAKQNLSLEDTSIRLSPILKGQTKGRVDWLESIRIKLCVTAMRKCGLPRAFVEARVKNWLQIEGLLPRVESVFYDDDGGQDLEDHVTDSPSDIQNIITRVTLKYLGRSLSPSAAFPEWINEIVNLGPSEIFERLNENDFRDVIRPFGLSFALLNKPPKQ